MENLEQLAADADALDREAAAADWLAGVAASEGDTANAERIQGEAGVMRAWAQLNRDVIAAGGEPDDTAGVDEVEPDDA